MATIIWSSNGLELFAHFKSLGNRDQFNAILLQFKQEVEVTQWSARDRVWRAPVEKLPQLVRFADRQQFRLVWAGHNVQPTQLALFASGD